MSKPGAFAAPGGLTVVATGVPNPPGTGTLAICLFSHGSGFGPLATTVVLLAPSGGVAPYKYAWAYVSGDRRPTYNLGPDLDEGQWEATVHALESFTATWKWTVTDARGAKASGQVSVSFQSDL